MALVEVEGLSFSYPDAPRSSLRSVSLQLEPGEVVALLGPSGSGKSTLIRALGGLVPHFHGGRMVGRVEVGGLDTRRRRPAELTGIVATVFQDPEDQLVMTGVTGEVAFGLENLGVDESELGPRALAALEAVGAAHLATRRTEELSGGELQRVCLASAIALEPDLLLLDEPTSQLDPEGADTFLELASARGSAVLLSEHRPARALERASRVLFLEEGRIALDAGRDEALDWLAANRPAYAPREAAPVEGESGGELVARLHGIDFGYGGGSPVLSGAQLELRRGEVVVLTGPNGSGKTTLAKVAAGLLEPQGGRALLRGRAAYLQQDCGRYLVRERVDEEVTLGARCEVRAVLRAVGLEAFAGRHPRDLSAGERERVALAAVLATEPDLLVLDEPTRGMDPDRKEELAALVRRHACERATLVVTHDRVFAADVGDREVALGTEAAVRV